MGSLEAAAQEGGRWSLEMADPSCTIRSLSDTHFRRKEDVGELRRSLPFLPIWSNHGFWTSVEPAHSATERYLRLHRDQDQRTQVYAVLFSSRDREARAAILGMVRGGMDR